MAGRLAAPSQRLYVEEYAASPRPARRDCVRETIAGGGSGVRHVRRHPPAGGVPLTAPPAPKFYTVPLR